MRQISTSDVDQLATFLEQQIPQIMLKRRVPGLSAALVSDAALAWSRSFGRRNAASNDPATPQTIFEAASLSKPVVAFAALDLCAAGRLSLDQPLASCLPADMRTAEPDLSLVTLRHVLSHTTGLPNWRPRDQPLRLQSAPGLRFGYSGEGFVYLQQIIEHITSQPLNDFIESTVFNPLGMGSSSYVWRADYAERIAVGHDTDGRALEKNAFREANAAYSLYTTAEDFARFMSAVFRHKARADQMFTAQIQIDESVRWGLGWGLCQLPDGLSIWHWGDNTWFTCFALGWPEQQAGLVLMTNSVFGLEACREIVGAASGGDFPAFRWLFNSFYGDSQ